MFLFYLEFAISLCASVFHFPIGILGQVWYLIVSIPDLCTLIYFNFELQNVTTLMRIHCQYNSPNP